MKLLTKTSYYYILYTIPVVILSAVFIYYFLSNEIEESNKPILLSRVKTIENYIKNKKDISLEVLQSNNEVYVSKINNSTIIPQTIKDTLIYSDIEKELLNYKVLELNSKINGTNYKIRVLKNSMEFDEILEVVMAVFITLLFLLFFIIFLINIKISKKLWQPFWTTLEYIKNFNVTANENMKLHSNDITEFNELNTSINQMTSKMMHDYRNQKKFTENASHEFQTPLAIIKGKIDLLLQTQNLDEESLQLLIAIEDTTSRLSRINKSLLLLSKIENRQYEKTEDVLLLSLIEKLLVLNEDLISDKNLKFTFENKENLHFKMNAELGYTLFNNLIQNAIRHNIENGSITIAIKSNSISISNTGNQTPLDSNLIFERFEKQSTHTNSIGLGLSIVKEIAEVYNIQISYFYENNQHIFSLTQLA
jgi:signal transduction histidine kinase